MIFSFNRFLNPTQPIQLTDSPSGCKKVTKRVAGDPFQISRGFCKVPTSAADRKLQALLMSGGQNWDAGEPSRMTTGSSTCSFSSSWTN